MQTTFMPWLVDGSVVGITNTTIDITERKQAERASAQALASSKRRSGSRDWGPGRGIRQAGTVTWSAQIYELFGRDPAAGPAMGDALFPYIHPDDRQRVRKYERNPFAGGVRARLSVRHRAR